MPGSMRFSPRPSTHPEIGRPLVGNMSATSLPAVAAISTVTPASFPSPVVAPPVVLSPSTLSSRASTRVEGACHPGGACRPRPEGCRPPVKIVEISPPAAAVPLVASATSLALCPVSQPPTPVALWSSPSLSRKSAPVIEAHCPGGPRRLRPEGARPLMGVVAISPPPSVSSLSVSPPVTQSPALAVNS